MSMQNLEHLRNEIPNLLLMTNKNDQSLKQHCHPYQKQKQKKKKDEIPSKNNVC